ncbi:hypothetical protein [Cereibacter sphaeroides]|uniref:hypothetical protein n=1 Tax=Cereibacter sphaeroides TaxID=1063 RepID=UPI003AAC84BE
MSLGRALPHDAAPLHVTGAARYVDDLPTPRGTLHLAFGLSPVAHGEILTLDLDPVRRMPGVVRVIGPGDLDPMPDCSPRPMTSRSLQWAACSMWASRSSSSWPRATAPPAAQRAPRAPRSGPCPRS